MTDEPADDGQEPDEAELFPNGSLAGEKITPQQFIKKGTPIKVVASIGKSDVPLTTGMIPPDRMGRALVHYAFVKNEEVPQFEGEGSSRKITSWKIRQHLAATWVEPANDEATLIRAEFEALMALDANAAVALATELKETATGLRAVA